MEAHPRKATACPTASAASIAWNNFDPNSNWLASAIFAPQNRAKVEAALREEIARALKDGFNATELDAGRSGLLNFRRLSRAQDDVLASQLASNLYLGRTFEVSAARSTPRWPH